MFPVSGYLDEDCLIYTPVPLVALVQLTWWCSHVGGCLDRNWLIDRQSMPDFVLNPHGNIPLWGAVQTKTV